MRLFLNKTLRTLIPATLCLFMFGVTVVAQRGSLVCGQVEASIAAKAPSWKVTRKSKSCHWLSYFQWKSGKSEITVFLYPLASRDDALKTFQLLADDDELVGEKTNSLGTGLREIGDDNRVWATPSAGARGVDFRKGNVVVRVIAPTMELALQFAAYIVQAVPTA